MKKLTPNEQGFIPMMITIVVIVVAVIYFVYTRVLHANT
jgi:cell division protein FtsL